MNPQNTQQPAWAGSSNPLSQDQGFSPAPQPTMPTQIISPTIGVESQIANDGMTMQINQTSPVNAQTMYAPAAPVEIAPTPPPASPILPASPAIPTEPTINNPAYVQPPATYQQAAASGPNRGQLQQLFQRGGPMPGRSFKQILQQHEGQYLGQSQPAMPVDTTQVDPLQEGAPSQMQPAAYTAQYAQQYAQPQPLTQQFDMPAGMGSSSYGKIPKRKLLTLAIACVVIVGVLGTGGTFAKSILDRNSPENIFNQAIAKSLSTSSVTQTQEVENAGETVTQYDLANVRDPKVSATTHIKTSGSEISTEGFSTLQDGYFRILSGKSTTDSAYKNVADKWLIIRSGGLSIEASKPYFTLFGDPYDNLFGEYIFGNFNATESKALMKFIKKNPPYKFSADKVRTVQLDGKDTLVYEVSFAMDNLKAFNKLAGKYMGINDTIVATSFEKLNTSGATMYIDKVDKHLVKLTTKENVGETISVYKNYDATTVGAKPTVAITAAQYAELLAQHNSPRD